MVGAFAIFAAGCLVGGLVAVLLLCALVMASASDDGEGGDYRAGGGWH